MTRATLLRHRNTWCGFVLEGHSDRLPAGESVVCAAVSSAAYLVANTVTDVCGCRADTLVQDGYLSLRVNVADSSLCQPILEGFYRHLQGLQEQYPKKIQLDLTEV